MLYAMKGNKVVKVDETTKQRYINDGFNIYEDGKLISFGKGVSISPTEHEKVLEENKMLRLEVKESREVIETLKAEIDRLNQEAVTDLAELDEEAEAELKAEADIVEEAEHKEKKSKRNKK